MEPINLSLHLWCKPYDGLSDFDEMDAFKVFNIT